jgi:hypothetical protein
VADLVEEAGDALEAEADPESTAIRQCCNRLRVRESRCLGIGQSALSS